MFRRHWLVLSGKIILLSLICGWILYQSFGPGSTLVISLAFIGFLLLPFIFIFKSFAKHVLFVILLLTMAFNIDQTLFIQNHNGGAAGFVISLNGLVLLILFMICIYESFQKQEFNHHLFKPEVFVLLGLNLAALISLAVARDRLLGLYEWLELTKMMGIFLYLRYALISRQFSLSLILHVIVICIAMQGVVGLLQYSTGSTLNLTILGGQSETVAQKTPLNTLSRVGGTLGGPNAFAWYLDFVLPIPISILLLAKKKRNLLMNIIAVVLGLLALYLTLSRGGWLGILVSGIIILAVLTKRLHPMKRFYIILIMILIALIGLVLILGIANPVRDRFLAEDGGSAYVRIPLMHVAVNIIQHNPIFGIGLNNYTLVHHEYDFTEGKVSTYFPYPVHNIFFQLAAEIGILGLILFLLFLGIMLYQAIQLTRQEDPFISALGVGLMASIVGGMIQAQVENATIGAAQLLPLWILAGLISGLWEKESTSKFESQHE